MMEWRLRDALKKQGCPVCALARETSKTFHKWFVIETYGVAPMLESLNRGGFCQQHAWEVARVSGRRLSFTYDFLVRCTETKLQRLMTSALSLCARQSGERGDGRRRVRFPWTPLFWLKYIRRRKLSRAISDFQRKEPCPLCQMLENDETHAIHTLIPLLQEAEGRGMFSQSDGLCMDHFYKALEQAPPEVVVFLASDCLRRMGELIEGFREFFRKEDYRFSSEPKGEEQTTWLRAVWRFAGSSRVPYGRRSIPVDEGS